MSSNCLEDPCLASSSQLTHIFGISIKYGIFPNDWKVATIVPVFKGGNKRSLITDQYLYYQSHVQF